MIGVKENSHIIAENLMRINHISNIGRESQTQWISYIRVGMMLRMIHLTEMWTEIVEHKNLQKKRNQIIIKEGNLKGLNILNKDRHQIIIKEVKLKDPKIQNKENQRIICKIRNLKFYNKNMDILTT